MSCRGTESGRDEWVYNYSKRTLSRNISRFAEFYEEQLDKWNRTTRTNAKAKVDEAIDFDDQNIKWTSSLKIKLVSNTRPSFSESNIYPSLYRPFVRTFQYYDHDFTHRPGPWYRLLAANGQKLENVSIVATDIGMRAPFSVLCTDLLPDFHLCATADTFRCFPFYEYDENGSNRRENITDGSLQQFRAHYKDKKITKWDIFYYTYGVLHDPEYRTRYAANLKRELPRIPYAPDFWAYSEAGKRLSELHVDYETQPQYKLKETINKDVKPFNWRVEKMRLSKDKGVLTYNECLTLSGIPKEIYEYRLGNRSALEWVVDQYQVSKDKRSGIVNDPNREDDPEYIYKLVGQVITVSLETVRIVKSLPGLGLPN